jgi:PKD repeat protein
MKTIAFKLIGFFVLLFSSTIFAADGPVTYAENVVNAVPGTPAVSIPVKVTGFTDIGKFILTLTFDTTKVRYVASMPNPGLVGMTVVYSKPVGNTKGKLVLSWTSASNVSLLDESVLADLTFSYVTGTGILSWTYTFGSECNYWRRVGASLTLLNIDPKYVFLKNGGISNRGAPITYAPNLTPSGPGALPVAITVSNFTNISGISLMLEFDPLIITYQNTFVKNPAFGGNFQVGVSNGTGGRQLITIGWYGSSTSLANGATLCTLNFIYNGASGTTSLLDWIDNIGSCEYADGSGSVLIDLPHTDYFANGSIIAPLVAADFSADKLFPLKDETVQFTDLSTGGANSWSWSFDPSDVVYVGGTSSTSQNPQVKFSGGGLYSVSLNVQNNYSSDIEVKTNYLRVGTAGLWTGITSSDWTDISNWDNYLVPDGSIDVIIPSFALYWPVFDGDLIIGFHCNNLTLSGPTSYMTVTGDLSIP